MFHKNTFELGGVKAEGEIPGTSKQYSVDLTVRSTFRRAPRQVSCTHTPASVHQRNTTAKRPGIAKQLLGQISEVTERKDADIIGGDFNTSAFRKLGKAKVSSIEEAWEETLLIPDSVSMWAQMEDSRDCSRFVLTKEERCKLGRRQGIRQHSEELLIKATDQEAPNWRVFRQQRKDANKRRQTGVFSGNKEKMQISETEQAAHLLVHIHLCESRAAGRSARSETAKHSERSAEKKQMKRNKHVRHEFRPVCFWCLECTRSSFFPPACQMNPWFEVRLKGPGKKQPLPTDEI